MNAAAIFAATLLAFQFHSDVRLVVLHATVTGKHGAAVEHLPAGAFRVSEQGKPQPLSEAVREDVPVTVGLFIDESGSTARMRPLMSEALTAMSLALKPEDELFVGHFGMFVTVDRPPAPAGAAVGLGAAPLNPTATRLYDCVIMAMDYAEKHSRRDKQAVVFVTDGRDTTSLASLKKVVEECRKRLAIVYAIGFGDKHGMKALEQIAAASGGRAFAAGRAEELPGIALEIAREIRGQYTLVYTPADDGEATGTWRSVTVTVAGRRDLRVRCRPGYVK